ncbi:DUF7019 family protein [Streptomyces sp. NPDC001651]|uniref:DUF7019 family protein n=1 Tax=Streptomyces sp. NPDC001651 TaxID=3364596 RepID=UPI00369A2E32
MRYYNYVSEAKVDMLFGQIPPSLLSGLATADGRVTRRGAPRAGVPTPVRRCRRPSRPKGRADHPADRRTPPAPCGPRVTPSPVCTGWGTSSGRG